MHDCIFCKIIDKQIPAEILFEDDHVIAVLDINPINYGHTLIIPKVHCRDFLALPEESYGSVLHAAKIIANALVIHYKLEGYNLFSNNGSIAGQSVFHFHLHVTPRYRDDNIRFVLNLKHYGDGEVKVFGDTIRKTIQSSLISNKEI
jgi:histidine triad (HIT) family protein